MALAGADTLAVSGTRRGPELVRGDTVGRYIVTHVLGAGGMGVVYAAYDPELDRKVALKLLHPDRAAGHGSESRHLRLLREAQALARLSHPNVLGVHDVGEHDGRVFLAAEFVDGVTLTLWANRGPHAHAEVLAIFRQAGLGLAAAHAAGLVHRDFKPDNVMISPEPPGPGRVRVMDFGLALATSTPAIEQAAGDAERSGAATGTPAYMAPEQHLSLEVDARADQFAFCVALWELLYGQRPFLADNLAQLAVRVTEGAITEPPRDADVPTWLRRVITRGLAPHARDRYGSMNELLDALAADPTPRRRRLAIAGVIAVGIGGAFVAQRAVLAERRADCDALAREIEAVWNAPAAGALALGFVQTGFPQAEDTAARIRPRLDAWTQQWSELRSAACVADTLDHSLSAEAHALRDGCLDERRAELEVLLEIFAAPERDVVNYAERSVVRLSRLEACTDDTRLAASAATLRGSDPEAVRSVRRGLIRSAQLEGSGHRSQAVAAAAAAETLARETGSAALIAEAQVRHGTALARSGDSEAAATTLADGYYAAGETGADEVALDAATQLVQVVGLRLARFAQGLEWARHAEMLLGRLDLRADYRAATLASYVGNVHRGRDDLVAARAAQERALAIREQWFGPDHPELAPSLQALATIANVSGELDEAERLLERAAQLLTDAYGPDYLDLAAVYATQCSVALDRGDYARARERCQAAVAIRERLLAPDDLELASAVANLANTLLALGELAAAREQLLRVIAIRERRLGPEHPDVANALNNLGLLEALESHYERALEHYTRALVIREHSLPPDHIDIASLLTNIADVHGSMRQPELALPLYQRALGIAERARGPDDAEVGRALSGMGGALVQAERASEAIDPLERALASRAASEGDPLWRCRVLIRLADALWNTGRDRPRALTLIDRAEADCADGGPRGAPAGEEIAKWRREHPAAHAGG